MAGNQVLDWSDLDSEIKTVGLKDVSCDVSSHKVHGFDRNSLLGPIVSSRCVSLDS